MKHVMLVSCAALLCFAETAAFAQVRQPPRTRTGTLTPRTPPPALTMLTLGHDSISGGFVFPTGRVALSGAAPTGGLLVTLTSDNAAATVPQSVNVIAGQTQAQFSIATAPVTAPIFARITARAGSATLTDSLKLLLRVVSVVEAGWV